MSKLNRIIHLGILKTVPRFLFNCLNHVLWPGHISYFNSSAIVSVFQKALFVNRGQLSIRFCVTAFFLGKLVVSERSLSQVPASGPAGAYDGSIPRMLFPGHVWTLPTLSVRVDTHGAWCKDQHWRGAMNVTRNSTSPLPSGFSSQ